MADKPLTARQVKQLQKQIQHDQAQPIKPAEKRFKIDNPKGFDSMIGVLGQRKESK